MRLSSSMEEYRAAMVMADDATTEISIHFNPRQLSRSGLGGTGMPAGPGPGINVFRDVIKTGLSNARCLAILIEVWREGLCKSDSPSPRLLARGVQ